MKITWTLTYDKIFSKILYLTHIHVYNTYTLYMLMYLITYIESMYGYLHSEELFEKKNCNITYMIIYSLINILLKYLITDRYCKVNNPNYYFKKNDKLRPLVF